MDARRVGCETPVGGSFLERAAPAYLDPSDRARAPDTWFETGLHQATHEIRGIAALTEVRREPGVGPADGYLLHDYLDQYGRLTRRGALVPAAVWDALIADVRDSRTGPGSRSKPSGADSTATLSNSRDPPRRLARPLRCNCWRGGWPRQVTVPRRTAGRGRPRKRATRWRCSSTPSGSTTRATATEPTRSSHRRRRRRYLGHRGPCGPARRGRQDRGRRTRPDPGGRGGRHDGDATPRGAPRQGGPASDATGWLRRAAEADDTFAMQRLAAARRGRRAGRRRTVARPSSGGG